MSDFYSAQQRGGGVTAVESGLPIGLIAIVVIAALSTIGTAISTITPSLQGPGRVRERDGKNPQPGKTQP